MEKIVETVLKFLRLEGLMDSISGYVETRVELIKLEIREEVAKIVSRGIILAFILLIGLLFLIFASAAVAQLLNSRYANPYIGYSIVSGFYGIVFLLVILFRKSIDRQFEKTIIENLKKRNPDK